MDNTYETTSHTEFDKWYVAPVTDPKSCCALREVVTEYGCQGLEIDMPIIGWGNDMKWVDGKWAKFRPYQPKTSDENTFRKNSYRILLTRGRDGFIIFVPPVEELDVTYDVLRKAGIKDLT